MFRLRLAVFVVLAAALALPGAAWANHATYKITYFSFAHTSGAPDALVRIINPGSATISIVNDVEIDVPSDLCAMIYVFRPDQQLEECCGCKITPNGLLTLSVNDDLTSNPVHGTPFDFPTGVIKVVSARPTLSKAPPGSSPDCNPADLLYEPSRELREWGTHVQDGGGFFVLTETAFEGNDHNTMLSTEEELRLKTLCAINTTGVFDPFIPPQGSGKGTCHCPGENGNGTASNGGVDPPIVGTVNPPALLPKLPALP